MAAIEVENLRRDYGSTRAVDDLSFSVEPGEIFALLGPNGAGKTTTVEIVEGHRRRTAGRVSVLGHDPESGGRAYRERIGIVLQEAGFDEDFSVHELVRHTRSRYPRQLGADEVIDLVGLTEKRTARVKTLSGGQRRRLDLALALVGDPDVLFLDEPTTGFDPSARRRAWELVESLRNLGKTVLLTTHYLDEAEHLSDRVGVVVRGRMVATGTPAELGASARSHARVRFRVPDGVGPTTLPDLGVPLTRNGVEWEAAAADPGEVLYRLTSWAHDAGLHLPDVQVTRPSLEDVYLEMVGATNGAAEPLAVA